MSERDCLYSRERVDTMTSRKAQTCAECRAVIRTGDACYPAGWAWTRAVLCVQCGAVKYATIEAARAWSEARGLAVEWCGAKEARADLGDDVRLGLWSYTSHLGHTQWQVELVVDGGWDYDVERCDYRFTETTPTAALDAAAEQAARLCGALAKLGGTYHPPNCQCEGCLLGYCQAPLRKY